MKNKLFKTLFFILPALMLSCISCEKEQKDYWGEIEDKEEEEENKDVVHNSDKPRYIWVDASANFPDFANSKENIARDLALAKDAGFTDIVVTVRPGSGDVLFETSHVDKVEYLYAWVSGTHTKIDRTATWDYLQAFIDEGKKLDLRIHASINTFHGGTLSNGGTGMLFREPEKRDWATSLNTIDGIKNVMDLGNSTKFLNPANDEVQEFLCNLLIDLAKYDDLDGIFLDYGRYSNLQSDFSDVSKAKFEKYIGNITIQNFPEDVLPKGAESLPATYPKYMLQWLEFRAKVIHDFMVKARAAVKSQNPDIKFGVYVGAWYSTYYTTGVNWASKKYDAGANHKWASSKYKDYGYADLMDHMLLGAYANPGRVYGSNEWTMEGFSTLGYHKIMGDSPIVVAGPDVGNWDTANNYTQEQENEAIVNSVKACMDPTDGYFLFDMIHLKNRDQWKYAKEGIDKAIAED